MECNLVNEYTNASIVYVGFHPYLHPLESFFNFLGIISFKRVNVIFLEANPVFFGRAIFPISGSANCSVRLAIIWFSKSEGFLSKLSTRSCLCFSPRIAGFYLCLPFPVFLCISSCGSFWSFCAQCCAICGLIRSYNAATRTVIPFSYTK